MNSRISGTYVRYWPKEAIVGPRPTAEEIRRFNIEATETEARAARTKRWQKGFTYRWFCKEALRRGDFRAAFAHGLRALADWIE